MKVLNCDVVDVSQQALAELPQALLGPALQRLLKDGHLLARNGSPTPTLFRLQTIKLDGAMITAAGAEPPKAKRKRGGYVKQPRWRAISKAESKAISAALRKRRTKLKLSQEVFAKQIGVSANTLSNYECGRLGGYISKTLGDSLKRLGLGALVPRGGN